MVVFTQVWLLSSDTMLLTSGFSTATRDRLNAFHGGADADIGTAFHGGAGDDEAPRDTDVKYFRIAKILYQHRKDEPFAR